MNSAGGDLQQLAPAGSAGPAWSAAGTKLAYYAFVDGQQPGDMHHTEIFVVNADGSGGGPSRRSSDQLVTLQRGDPKAARRHLALAARTARENLTEARAMVAAQGPSALASDSLEEPCGARPSG